jgi:hypothetical protein
MNLNNLVKLIKNVAEEQDYSVTDGDVKFQVFIDRYNAVAFEIWANSSSGYVQVHQWEGGDSADNGKYGRGVYSLRDYSDAVQFCNIMIASAALRARRPSA